MFLTVWGAISQAIAISFEVNVAPDSMYLRTALVMLRLGLGGFLGFGLGFL